MKKKLVFIITKQKIILLGNNHYIYITKYSSLSRYVKNN